MKIILLVISFIFITSSVNADVYLVYKDDTKDIYSVSNQDDAVVPNGHTRVIIIGVASDFPNDIQDYQYINGKLKLNFDKIRVREDEMRVSTEERLKKIAYFESAKSKLIALGLTSDEIDSLR